MMMIMKMMPLNRFGVVYWLFSTTKIKQKELVNIKVNIYIYHLTYHR